MAVQATLDTRQTWKYQPRKCAQVGVPHKNADTPRRISELLNRAAHEQTRSAGPEIAADMPKLFNLQTWALSARQKTHRPR